METTALTVTDVTQSQAMRRSSPKSGRQRAKTTGTSTEAIAKRRSWARLVAGLTAKIDPISPPITIRPVPATSHLTGASRSLAWTKRAGNRTTAAMNRKRSLRATDVARPRVPCQRTTTAATSTAAASATSPPAITSGRRTSAAPMAAVPASAAIRTGTACCGRPARRDTPRTKDRSRERRGWTTNPAMTT